jgi:2-oxoglutarate dehydrogenase E2 component (dihydrolipoamide succinyltransferase)
MEIATDKVDSDVPSPVSGKLLERFYKDNDVVQVGAVIAIIETAEPEAVIAQHLPPTVPEIEAIHTPPPVEVIAPPSPAEEVHPPVVQPAIPAQQQPPSATIIPEEIKPPVLAERVTQAVPYIEQLEHKEAPQQEDGLKNGLRFYSPLVKNIAAQEGISNAELDKIPGTGAEGRLTKDDLLNYIENRLAYTPTVVSAPAEETPVNTSTKEQEEFTATSAPVQVTEATRVEPITETPKAAVAPESPKPEPVFEKPKEGLVTPPASESTAKSSASVSGNDEIIEMDRMRRLIADHMIMSKQTSAHVTSFVEADVTNLVLWREKIKNSFQKREGEKITFTPLFIEAVVRAIKDMPMINVQVNGTQIIKKKDINISMATALPSGNLIVPVIKRADELSLIGLTKAVNDLANRARTGKLKPDDVQGGTFTITNVGSFGNVMGTPIINQPQVAILAVGAIKKKPAVIETLQGDMIGIRHMMFLSLSYDHRVVDGALGGSFVRRVADYLENWDPGREI